MREPPLGPLTRFIVIFCALIFAISALTTPSEKGVLPLSPLKKAFLFDFPKAYQLNRNIPYWTGFYDQIVSYFKEGKPIQINAPLFEKIKEGEISRFFTPIFLHGDLLHLLFNMTWAIVLGRQIESRIGIRKTLIFILITAFISNTAQYLMSGPNFVGYSGVLCGMFGFIFVRQKKAPWEAYDLDRSTFLFILVFVLGILLFQVIAFLFEIFLNVYISPNIANTAHITGGLTGIFLALTPYFSRKDTTYRL
jgi:GlpG protein